MKPVTTREAGALSVTGVAAAARFCDRVLNGGERVAAGVPYHGQVVGADVNDPENVEDDERDRDHDDEMHGLEDDGNRDHDDDDCQGERKRYGHALTLGPLREVGR